MSFQRVITVRVPPELHAEIKRDAGRCGESMNVFCIESVRRRIGQLQAPAPQTRAGRPPTRSDAVLATRLVKFLNELVKFDRAAVERLIRSRVPCNQALAEHATVQVAETGDGFEVGLLGILNGLCGVDESGYALIASRHACTADGDVGELIEFDMLTAPQDEPTNGALPLPATEGET